MVLYALLPCSANDQEHQLVHHPRQPVCSSAANCCVGSERCLLFLLVLLPARAAGWRSH